MKIRFLSAFLLIAIQATVMSSCTSGNINSVQGEDLQTVASSNLAIASHSNDTEPNYATIFPQDSVNRLDIILTSEAWTALQTEMEDQFGQSGMGNGMGRMGGQPAELAQPGDAPQSPEERTVPSLGEFQPGEFSGSARPGGAMPAGMGRMDFGSTSYVSSTVIFNGETWNSVGFRYSGNSTLQTSWASGTKKISFRLDFNEFEDQDTTTNDQRFYGFKQISFKSNAMDDSYLREKVASDIFNQAGVIAPKTSFYEIFIDYGEGVEYFGLYTAVEIVDDTLIETAFSSDDGNVYKPEGTGATFVEGTFNEESFEKQTNAEEADWSDILALFDALHSHLRETDPQAWRTGLEKVFAVDVFLRWLATDTIMQNWDTYGAMAHNYYLYNDPTENKLTWIPWDNNMSLSASAGGPGLGTPEEQVKQDGANFGRVGAGLGGRGVRELDLSSVSDQWPLIRFLIDDPIYLAKYQQYLQETIDNAFQPEELKSTYQAYHDLIAPYVEQETEEATQIESIERFNQAVEELIQHAQNRYDAVLQYLGES